VPSATSALRGIGGLRVGDRHRHEAQAVTGHELADLPAIGRDHHEGADEPPSEGPSGPRMIGMSPVKSTAPMA
jgi:hypothetical protein